MFFGLFRKSNVLAPGGAFDPGKHLCRSDFLVHSWGIEIKVKWSKTLQYRERSLSVPIPFIPGNKLCPATAVIRAFKLSREAHASGPAFVFPVLHGLVALCYPRFISMLRDFLVRLGLNPKQYAGHSFRRGGATFALQAGIPIDVIMTQGDWKSDAYKAYIDVPLSYKASCLAKVALLRP
jgi:integrase